MNKQNDQTGPHQLPSAEEAPTKSERRFLFWMRIVLVVMTVAIPALVPACCMSTSSVQTDAGNWPHDTWCHDVLPSPTMPMNRVICFRGYQQCRFDTEMTRSTPCWFSDPLVPQDAGN